MYTGQAGQDRFVVNILKGKMNGYFLEIGSNSPVNISNTFILEKRFNWKGIMIEYDPMWLPSYKAIRKNSKHVIKDATKIDYKKLLENSPKDIDYLQVDVEAENGSTIETLEKLDNEILDSYRFAVVTFEHDYYRAGDYKDTRTKSRKIFEKRGYKKVFFDVNDNSPEVVFEDWWVHPALVDLNHVNLFIETNQKNYKPNALTEKSINWADLIYLNEIPLFNKYIVIGSSNTNTKIIRFNQTIPSDIKFVFIHGFTDTHSYKVINNELHVTRTDSNRGWTQNLIGYIFR